MSKSAQQSAFKQLFTEILAQGGDFSKVSKDLKRPLKTYVKESYPHFLVTDGYFFVQAHFTKEAVAEFKSKFANVNITELHDRVIVLNSWTSSERSTLLRSSLPTETSRSDWSSTHSSLTLTRDLTPPDTP